MSRRTNRPFCCAQLSNEDFFPRHQRLWRGLRNLLTGSSVPVRAAALAAELQPLLHDGWRAGTEVCRDATHPPHIVYSAVESHVAVDQPTACKQHRNCLDEPPMAASEYTGRLLIDMADFAWTATTDRPAGGDQDVALHPCGTAAVRARLRLGARQCSATRSILRLRGDLRAGRKSGAAHPAAAVLPRPALSADGLQVGPARCVRNPDLLEDLSNHLAHMLGLGEQKQQYTAASCTSG